MLKNIASVISPDLLWLLASIGHGDDLVLVDRNFPSIKVAKQTSTGRLIELPGVDLYLNRRNALLGIHDLNAVIVALKS